MPAQPRHIVPRRMDDAISEYLDWLRAVKGRAPSTLRNTESVLRRLCRFQKNPMIYNLERNQVSRYLGERGRVLATDSVNQEKTRISTFLKWCEEEQFIDTRKNIRRDLSWVKPIQEDRQRLTADQFPALYDAARCSRDRMLMVMLTDTLMRSSEAVSVKWGHVDLDRAVIEFTRWKTKQASSRVPISMQLDQELRRYWIWYESKIGRSVRPDDHLICSLRLFAAPGGLYAKSDDTIELFPERAMSRVHEVVQQCIVDGPGLQGRAGRFSPLLREGGHTLRRSAARELLEALFRDEDLATDEALLMVMTMLGHANVDMTMRYIGYKADEEKVMALLKGKDWWRHSRPAQVVPIRASNTES